MQEKTDERQKRELDPEMIRLRRSARGHLVLQPDADTDPIEPVRVVRCFPWSLRDRFVSIRDKDGNEVVLLKDLETIEGQTHRLVEEELASQDFIPHIEAVESVDDRMQAMTWQVRTDRGPIELQIKSTDDVRQLDDQRIAIKDHAGGMFEIVDLGALDPRSQRLVEEHMG